MDGDGYYSENECGIGSELGWDCDDSDPTISPDSGSEGNGYFTSEYFDLNDNQVPYGWDFETARSANIASGRINAFIIDGYAGLSKSAEISCSTNEIILEMDAYMAYSYWGLKPIIQIFSGEKYLQFRTGEEDYDHPKGNLANEVYFRDGSLKKYIYEDLSPLITGINHLKLIMNDSGYEFSGVDPNGNESFKIFIDYSNYYIDFRDIDQIRFRINATTNNSGWIDNLNITVN